MLSLVMTVEPVWTFGVTVPPSSAATAMSTPYWPIVPGCWATSAWIVPALRSLTWLGHASKLTIFTVLVLPACLTPLALPSAAKRLVAKTPTMSGFFCSAEPIRFDAVAGSSWEYWMPTYWNFESAFTASSKPFARASVVEMPGSTDIIMTLPPFGLRVLIASNAALPPASLSEAIAEAAYDGSLVVVSTRMILIPAAAAAWRGACIAVTSVGAIMIAS